MIEFSEADNRTIATVVDTNRINSVNAADIKLLLSEKIGSSKSDVVLNLANIRFIDSTGINVILSALKQCREKNCNFSLQNVGKEVHNLLTLMKLDKIIDIE